MVQRGDFVWGKLKCYPWWPAMVLSPEDCGRKQNKEKVYLFWFGDHKYSEVDPNKIADFKACFSSNVMKCNRILFKKAVEEVLHILVSIHGLQFQDASSLLKWANSEFQSDTSLSARWNRSELPELVEAALRKSKNISTEDTDDSEDNMDIDTCFSCHKKDEKIISPHPLFIGNVCIPCKKYVDKAYKHPVGQKKDLCIICGHCGTLVHCSNNVCFRSFCRKCIECKVSKKEFENILEKDNWLCYLCETRQSKKCLIKRRITHHANTPSIPSTPECKSPITVLAFSETGLKALRKTKLFIKNYVVCPKSEQTCTCMDYSEHYKDFSYKEVKEISADLILGSFFIANELVDRRKCAIQFFLNFYRFMFRLDVTKLFKSNVFFIFMAEADIVDENILSRVMRFLLVNPLSLDFGAKKVLVWSNLSHCLSGGSKVLKKGSYIDINSTIEENVLYPYMKFLQKYFKVE